MALKNLFLIQDKTSRMNLRKLQKAWRETSGKMNFSPLRRPQNTLNSSWRIWDPTLQMLHRQSQPRSQKSTTTSTSRRTSRDFKSLNLKIWTGLKACWMKSLKKKIHFMGSTINKKVKINSDINLKMEMTLTKRSKILIFSWKRMEMSLTTVRVSKLLNKMKSREVCFQIIMNFSLWVRILYRTSFLILPQIQPASIILFQNQQDPHLSNFWMKNLNPGNFRVNRCPCRSILHLDNFSQVKK